MRFSPPYLTAAIAAIAVAIHFVPGAAEWLQYDRAALAQGEIWRLWTGHLTHFGFNHLAWDLGVLLALGHLGESGSRTRVGAALLLGATSISTALWCGQPQFQYYRGLSGLDCALGGLLAAALCHHRRTEAKLAGLLTLIFVAGKCRWEMSTASPVFATAGDYVPVPLAHLIGLIAGFVAGAAPARRVRTRDGVRLSRMIANANSQP